jgi:metal-sulfur cluster biosynthetic enzyme
MVPSPTSPADQHLKSHTYLRSSRTADDTGMAETELPDWARSALSDVYDPCCREKGISIVEMGLVRSVRVEAGQARVELLLTSGWCPFAATVVGQVEQRLLDEPGITDADVAIVWDEAWTTDRLAPRARRILRFLPPPSTVSDRDAYVAAHTSTRE